MGKKIITQKYYILTIDKNGNMPPMRKSECNAGLVAAGIMDLIIHGVISIEKKKIAVIHPLPDELNPLASLYIYLKEKPRTTNKVMSDYLMATGAKIKQLTMDIGISLTKDGSASEEEGGLFGRKMVYIPEKSCKDELIRTIKESLSSNTEIMPCDMALLCILQETKNLDQYFSKYEHKAFKGKLKELKKNPQNKMLTDMINYVNEMSAVFVALFLTTSI